VELGSESDSWLIEPKRGENKLGTSIKRKFKEVKDASKSLGGRARSLSTSNPPLDNNQTTLGTAPVAVEPADEPSSIADVSVPQLLQQGTPMTKVSNKKRKKVVFRLDPDQGQIVWESKSRRISTSYPLIQSLTFQYEQIGFFLVPIETIKELRSGADARYYREQFHLAQEYEDRWLTIVYLLDGNYKTLHLIAATNDVFHMWDSTLRKLHAIRQELMSGLGNIEMRQAIWEKHYWKGADEECDHKLDFDEVEKLCKRLNINSSPEDLFRMFKVSKSVSLDQHIRPLKCYFFPLCSFFHFLLTTAFSMLTAEIGITWTLRILGGLSNCSGDVLRLICCIKSFFMPTVGISILSPLKSSCVIRRE
jgi:hypothetical protein